MLQVIQDLRSGRTDVVEVPAPGTRPGHLVIRTRCSLVSAGTERMLVEFGRANVLEKARKQPEQVRQVIDKIKTDGLISTAETVLAKLGQPLALGYCNVGEVVEVGAGAEGFAVGDRVVSNGSHAEIVVVPKNLCARFLAGAPIAAMEAVGAGKPGAPAPIAFDQLIETSEAAISLAERLRGPQKLPEQS